MLKYEFDRQVQNLIQKGYPSMAGLNEDDFKKQLEPLRDKINQFERLDQKSQERYVPFVIAISRDYINGEKAMQLVNREEKSGFSMMNSDEIDSFKPIDGLELPNGIAYLVVDIDTGTATLNVTPNEAIKIISQENRSPLTIDEGIALITHHPEILRKKNGFSLLGSRCGNRRVTALWISQGKPKLGWCWAGNPHTWLGSASCGYRIGL